MKKEGITSESKVSFILREYHELTNFKSTNCKVLIKTDVCNSKTEGFIVLEKYSKSSCDEYFTGIIGYSELETCMSSLIFLKNKILSSNSFEDISAEICTMGNTKFGAFTNNGKWICYIQVKEYEDDSIEYFDLEKIDDLIDIMEEARQVIEDLIKNK